MDFIEALILGIVQGLTEFLPVSSSGHLLITRNILGVTASPLLFEIMVHVGTLVAVMWVFRKDIWMMIRHPFSKPVIYLAIATIPAVIVTLFFKDFIYEAFEGGVLGFSFLITAGLLLLANLYGNRRGRTIKTMTIKHPIIMGVMQAVAILPGVSRSGSTLAGGIFSGVDRRYAVRFGFLMSIPAILGSLVFQLKDLVEVGFGGMSLPMIGVAMAAAAISGIFAIKVMLKIVNNNKLWMFAAYVALLGIFVIVDQNFLHLVF